MIEFDSNTDEVIVTSEEPSNLGDGWDDDVEIAHVIGSALGWCWIGRNYLGYLDMFILSFSGVEPQISFVAAALALTSRRISADGGTSAVGR